MWQFRKEDTSDKKQIVKGDSGDSAAVTSRGENYASGIENFF